MNTIQNQKGVHKRIIIYLLISLFLLFPLCLYAQETGDAPSAISASPESSSINAAIAGVRIKEIAEIQGIRTNQLVGFGIVTGLEGTGDSSRSKLMKRLIANFIAAFDVDAAENEISSKNSAAVMVTADTPPFARPGQRIDVTVSSLQDARSLNGGILLQTPLKGANGNVYAVAQGMVDSSGGEEGRGTVGRVSDGAIVEREVLSRFDEEQNAFSLLLKRPDFSTAFAVYEAVSTQFPDLNVVPLDGSQIRVELSDPDPMKRLEIISQIEKLTIQPDIQGKVVINSSSGVVVMGSTVRIGPVSVSYDTADLEISPFSSMGSTGGLSEGGGQVNGGTEETAPRIEEGSFLLRSTTRVGDLVSVMKAAGLPIEDIIEIMKTIERAGALYGSLEVM
jgi:flagellar P-ring protein FlgI